MHKITLFTLVLGLLTLTLTPLAIADYTIFNGHDTQNAWVVYSTWRPASGDWPAGFRTRGWYRVRPGETRTLSVPSGNKWVYVRVTHPYPTEILPQRPPNPRQLPCLDASQPGIYCCRNRRWAPF